MLHNSVKVTFSDLVSACNNRIPYSYSSIYQLFSHFGGVVSGEVKIRRPILIKIFEYKLNNFE